MSTNVTELKRRLMDLHIKLHKFDGTLRTNFVTLDGAWKRLDKAWDGYAYQEFRDHWQKTRQMIVQYNELSRKYEAFLAERIKAMEEFEKGNL